MTMIMVLPWSCHDHDHGHNMIMPWSCHDHCHLMTIVMSWSWHDHDIYDHVMTMIMTMVMPWSWHHWLRFKGGSFGFLANFFLLVLFLYLCVTRMGFQGGLPIPSSLGDTAISRYRVMYGFELKCAEITAYCSPDLPLWLGWSRGFPPVSCVGTVQGFK